MGLEIYLQRFDPSGDESPVRPGVISELERAARDAIGESADECIDIAPDRRSFDIHLPGGTATVHETHAQFPIQELDPLSLRVMFELARTGDMAIVTEATQVRVILTDPAQHAGLPDGWVADDQISVCRSHEQLQHLLQDWFSAQTDYKTRVFPETQQPAPVGGGERDWAPGSRPAPPASFVYVEAKPGETATKQDGRISKYYRGIYKAGGPHRPENGIMMAERWRLTTPAGQRFFAYGYGGDKDNWLGMFRDFAASGGRALGWIENFDTFVQDDGRRFPLRACPNSRATD